MNDSVPECSVVLPQKNSASLLLFACGLPSAMSLVLKMHVQEKLYIR